MQLDDLKNAWNAHGEALQRSVAIDERVLREVMLRRVRFALVPYALWLGLEIVLGSLTTFLVGSVWWAHLDELRYVVLASAVGVFAIVMTALSLVLLVRITRLDYSRSVTSLQRDVLRIKVVAYRATKWALLGGIVLWLPVALVLFEAVFGVPALVRVDRLWLDANIVFGLVVFAIGQGLARKYAERPDLGPWARRFVDCLSGRSLVSVSGLLASIEGFRDEASGREP